MDSYKWELVAHANGYSARKHYDAVMFGIDRESYFTYRAYFMVYEDIGSLLSSSMFIVYITYFTMCSGTHCTFFLSAPNFPIAEAMLKAKSCSST